MMRLFILSVLFACLPAFTNKKPEVLELKDGPVKNSLKKGYRIYLSRNFLQEIERELEKKLPKPKK